MIKEFEERIKIIIGSKTLFIKTSKQIEICVITDRF